MKYGNKKIEIDGEVFDSKREANRFCELVLLQKAGEIGNLSRQVGFILIPNQYEGKKCLERAVKYVADFTYFTKDGEYVVEDAKGMRTPAYIIKRKLMLKVFGIKIKEV